jgi:hypothetical protein
VLGLELDGPLDDPGRAIDASELLVLLGGRPHRNAGASDLAVPRLRVEARVLLCVQFSLYVCSGVLEEGLCACCISGWVTRHWLKRGGVVSGAMCVSEMDDTSTCPRQHDAHPARVPCSPSPAGSDKPRQGLLSLWGDAVRTPSDVAKAYRSEHPMLSSSCSLQNASVCVVMM